MVDANPYAPPESEEGDESKPKSRAVFAGTPRDWTTMELLGLAWKRVNAQRGVMARATLLALGAPQLVSSLPQMLVGAGVVAPRTTELQIVALASTIGSFLLSASFTAGSAKMWLDVARGKKARFGDIYGSASRTLAVAAMVVLMSIAVVLGLLLFVIPGFLVMAGLSLAVFFVVDAKMGPIRALAASWEVTAGQRVSILGFWLASLCVVGLGALACGVGILVAYPVAYVALALIYLRVSGRGKRKKRTAAKSAGGEVAVE